MHSKHLTILLPLLVVLTMLASLITPSPVLAAGEPPPPPGEKSPKTQPAPAKPAPPAATVAEGTSYTAEIPVAAPEAPAETPDGAANAAAIALSVDAIAQAGAVLIGPSGNPLPLAAQDTVDVLIGGAVYFKGSGPACIAGFCYYDTIQHAIDHFFERNGSGLIYVPGSITELTPVNVINPPALNLSKLTGLAWNDTYNYSPRLTGGLLTIANMLKGFTVDGFYISQGIYAHDNAGTLRLQNLYVTNPAGTGIFVNNHKGNIDLFNVTVYGATSVGGTYGTQTAGDGAHLDNTAGTGNITIGNSSFNGNLRYGLYVLTHGSALLDRVEASNNQNWDGANLTVMKGATVKDSRFNGNQNISNGLVIYNYGTSAVKLTNVEAQGNTWDGLSLHAASDISINGALLADNTSSHGLEASSSGNITLNNINSLNNKYSVVADNHLSATPKTVTVNNSFFISSSAGDGLQVTSRGNVTLNHIYAEGNFGNGVNIDNRIYDGGSHTYKGSGSVSLLNTLGLNQFYSNHAAALFVQSKGAITVKGVYALSNHAGLVLDGCAIDQDPLHPTHYCLGKGNISISAVTIGYTSTGGGLSAMTGGAISLDGSSFISNKYGVELRNSVVSAGKPVTVTNSSFFSTFDPASVGLAVYSKGNITLNNVQANYNSGKLTYGPMLENVSGILLDNCLYVGIACTGSGSVSVLSSLGQSKALGNGLGDGLLIHSKGAIKVSGFSSTNNGGGAYIDNLPGAGTLTITNSIFSYNSGVQGGLMALSAKAITLTGVEASQNGGGPGAQVDNNYGTTTTDAITISKSHFDHNKGDGLHATVKGNLTLNNVSANLNNIAAGSYGADLTSLHGSITLKDTLGPNQFISNLNTGLAVVADTGAISISGVTALYNSGSGISLNNAAAAATKTVTAQKILAEHNGADGLNVKSRSNVTLNGVQANYNTNGWGVKIDNCRLVTYPPCAGSGNVSILATLGTNSASYNKTGMRIDTTGSVVVNGLTASYNTFNDGGVSGLSIYNLYQTAVQKPVTITKSSFNANQGAGMAIWASGVITLNGISASNNVTVTGYGLYLYNLNMPGSPAVNILATLGNNQFNNNAANGISIYSSGKIALNKVAANENGWSTNMSGAFLYTTNASSITITCSAFNHNQKYGLEVWMGTGTLTFKSVAANYNNPGLGDLLLPVGKVPVPGWTVCGH